MGCAFAFGGSGPDVAGFRRTHAEAMRAARLAALAGDSATAVTSYERVELVSLLASDLPRARRFVAAQALARSRRHPSPAERLRKTVLAFLVAGGSGTRAAKELYVHQNTVTWSDAQPATSSRPSATMSRAAASTSARCEKACGKFPRCLPVSPSYSSA